MPVSTKWEELPLKTRKYLRRKRKREQKKIERSENLGSFESIFDFRDLYFYGLQSCRLVRWKGSVQNFEMHLLSKTARSRRKVLNGEYEPDKYVHFMLRERGKIRPIDAPRIVDRQVHKLYTKKVLLNVYKPLMIHNNGASLEGKGFDFSMKQIRQDLARHYRKYGNAGSIILIDFSKFFPNADHNIIKQRHKQIIFNDEARAFGDLIVDTSPSPIGLPLGIETSQAEMIAYPTELDNYIKCQLRMEGAGHYMDDYYILVPPDQDPKEILNKVYIKATQLQLVINLSKTQIKSLNKEFVWCKTHYFFTDTGKIIMRGNRKNMKRDRRKLKHFVYLINNHTITWEELWTSYNGMTSYFKKYNDHNRILKLNRLFYNLFGFTPTTIEVFREKELLWSTLRLSDTKVQVPQAA